MLICVDGKVIEDGSGPQTSTSASEEECGGATGGVNDQAVPASNAGESKCPEKQRWQGRKTGSRLEREAMGRRESKGGTGPARR